jgi:hypothetical protein
MSCAFKQKKPTLLKQKEAILRQSSARIICSCQGFEKQVTAVFRTD